MAELGEIRVGDFVEWPTQGRNARGKVLELYTNGNVPEVGYTIIGTSENPALLIEVWHPSGDGWVSTSILAAKKLSAVTRIDRLQEPTSRKFRQSPKINRLTELSKNLNLKGGRV